jgi:hypothetical protein
LTVDGVLVDSSNTIPRSVGIKTNQDNTIIQNSEIHHSIEVFNVSNVIVRNNVSYGTDPQYMEPIINVKGGPRNVQIYGNTIHATTDGAVAIQIGSGSSCCWWDASTHIEAYNVVAYENVVINETANAHGTAIGLRGAQNSAFYNNVLIGGVHVQLDTGSENGFPPNPVPANPSFVNNIFYGNGGPPTDGYFGWSSYTGHLTFDHNDVYNYSSAIPTQTNAISGNPLFVNPVSDWHLQSGSPAKGSGVALSMPAYGGGTIDVSHDINGVQRAAPWDLGIYVMGAASPPPPSLSPDLITTSLSYNSATHIFTSVVKNQGTGPTPSGIVIGNGFYVDGKLVTWGAVPGPLAPGASVTIYSTGGGAYTIASGTHTIMVKANDYGCCGRFAESNETNNTLTQSITIGGS